jgi:hypothetical protein
MSQYIQIIAVVIVFAIYIYGLFKVIKITRGSSPNKGNIVIGFTAATLLLIYLILNTYIIEPVNFVQIMLTFGLVLATTLYAISAAKQADASVRMAEEMREQRRPIVIQKAVPPAPGIVAIYAVPPSPKIVSDHFEIRNVGNGPAIELEIMLLNKGKHLLHEERKTFFSQIDAPIDFFPQGLENQENHTCYILCRYRSVLSTQTKPIWYRTWLPFVPVKSQRGDRIIIQPQELEFDESLEKESY